MSVSPSIPPSPETSLPLPPYLSEAVMDPTTMTHLQRLYTQQHVEIVELFNNSDTSHICVPTVIFSLLMRMAEPQLICALNTILTLDPVASSLYSQLHLVHFLFASGTEVSVMSDYLQAYRAAHINEPPLSENYARAIIKSAKNVQKFANLQVLFTIVDTVLKFLAEHRKDIDDLVNKSDFFSTISDLVDKYKNPPSPPTSM